MATNINLNLVASADFTQVNEAIKRLQAQLAQLQSQFAAAGNARLAPNFQNSLKQFNQHIEATGQWRIHTLEAASAAEQLEKRITTNKIKFSDFTQALQSASRANNQFMEIGRRHVAMEEARALRVGKTTYVYEDLTRTTLSSSAAARANAVAIAAQNRALSQFATTIINHGKNLQWTGRQLTMGITMPLVLFGAQSAKIFNDIDKNLTNLSKVYGVGLAEPTKKELESVRKEVIDLATEMGKTLGVTAQEVTDIAAQFAAAGLTGKEMIAATKQASRMIVLGEADKQEAINATISLQTAYKLNTEELTEAVNFFNAAQAATSTSMGDLINAIPRVGPIVKGLGGTYKDMVAILTALKEGGVPAGEAANAIKNSLGRIISPTETAKKRLLSFGVDIENIVNKNAGNLTATLLELQAGLKGLDELSRQRAISELFGKYQFARMSAFIENFNAAGSQSAKVMEMMGISSVELANIADRQAEKIQKSASGRFKIAVETMKNALIPYGETFLNYFTAIVEKITEMADAIQQLPGPMKTFLKIMSGLTVAIGPLIMAAGLVGNMIGSLGQALVRLKSFGGAMISLFRGGGIAGFKTIIGGFRDVDLVSQSAVRAIDLFNESADSGTASAAANFAHQIDMMIKRLSNLHTQASTTTSAISQIGPAVTAASAMAVNQNLPLGPGSAATSLFPNLRRQVKSGSGGIGGINTSYSGLEMSHLFAGSRMLSEQDLINLYAQYGEEKAFYYWKGDQIEKTASGKQRLNKNILGATAVFVDSGMKDPNNPNATIKSPAAEFQQYGVANADFGFAPEAISSDMQARRAQLFGLLPSDQSSQGYRIGLNALNKMSDLDVVAIRPTLTEHSRVISQHLTVMDQVLDSGPVILQQLNDEIKALMATGMTEMDASAEAVKRVFKLTDQAVINKMKSYEQEFLAMRDIMNMSDYDIAVQMEMAYSKRKLEMGKGIQENRWGTGQTGWARLGLGSGGRQVLDLARIVAQDQMASSVVSGTVAPVVAQTTTVSTTDLQRIKQEVEAATAAGKTGMITDLIAEAKNSSNRVIKYLTDSGELYFVEFSDNMKKTVVKEFNLDTGELSAKLHGNSKKFKKVMDDAIVQTSITQLQQLAKVQTLMAQRILKSPILQPTVVSNDIYDPKTRAFMGQTRFTDPYAVPAVSSAMVPLTPEQQYEQQLSAAAAKKAKGTAVARGAGTAGMLLSSGLMMTGTGNETANLLMAGTSLSSMAAPAIAGLGMGTIATGGMLALLAAAPLLIKGMMVLIDKVSMFGRAMEGSMKVSQTEAEMLGITLDKIGTVSLKSVSDGAAEAADRISAFTQQIQALDSSDPLKGLVDSLDSLSTKEQLSLLQQKYLTLRIQGVNEEEARDFVRAILRAAGTELQSGFEVSQMLAGFRDVSDATELLKNQAEVAISTLEGSVSQDIATGLFGLGKDENVFLRDAARGGLGVGNLGLGAEADEARKVVEGFTQSVYTLLVDTPPNKLQEELQKLQEAMSENTNLTNLYDASVREVFEQSGMIEYWDALSAAQANSAVKLKFVTLAINGFVRGLEDAQFLASNPIEVKVRFKYYEAVQELSSIEDDLKSGLEGAATSTTFTPSAAVSEAAALSDAQQSVVDKLQDELDLRNQILDAQRAQLEYSNSMASLQQEYNAAIASNDLAKAAELQRQMTEETANYNAELERSALESRLSKEQGKLSEMNDQVQAVQNTATTATENLSDYIAEATNMVYEALAKGTEISKEELNTMASELNTKFGIPIKTAKQLITDTLASFKASSIMKFATDAAAAFNSDYIPAAKEAAILAAFNSNVTNKGMSPSDAMEDALNLIVAPAYGSGARVSAVQSGGAYKFMLSVPKGSGKDESISWLTNTGITTAVTEPDYGGAGAAADARPTDGKIIQSIKELPKLKGSNLKAYSNENHKFYIKDGDTWKTIKLVDDPYSSAYYWAQKDGSDWNKVLDVSTYASGGIVSNYEDGGRISGPGTGTSDSILARVSNGEFVMKANAVKHWGVDTLHAMNSSVPTYATGGYVGENPPIQRFMIGGEVLGGSTKKKKNNSPAASYPFSSPVSTGFNYANWNNGGGAKYKDDVIGQFLRDELLGFDDFGWMVKNAMAGNWGESLKSGAVGALELGTSIASIFSGGMPTVALKGGSAGLKLFSKFAPALGKIAGSKGFSMFGKGLDWLYKGMTGYAGFNILRGEGTKEDWRNLIWGIPAIRSVAGALGNLRLPSSDFLSLLSPSQLKTQNLKINAAMLADAFKSRGLGSTLRDPFGINRDTYVSQEQILSGLRGRTQIVQQLEQEQLVNQMIQRLGIGAKKNPRPQNPVDSGRFISDRLILQDSVDFSRNSEILLDSMGYMYDPILKTFRPKPGASVRGMDALSPMQQTLFNRNLPQDNWAVRLNQEFRSRALWDELLADPQFEQLLSGREEAYSVVREDLFSMLDEISPTYRTENISRAEDSFRPDIENFQIREWELQRQEALRVASVIKNNFLHSMMSKIKPFTGTPSRLPVKGESQLIKRYFDEGDILGLFQHVVGFTPRAFISEIRNPQVFSNTVVDTFRKGVAGDKVDFLENMLMGSHNTVAQSTSAAYWMRQNFKSVDDFYKFFAVKAFNVANPALNATEDTLIQVSKLFNQPFFRGNPSEIQGAGLSDSDNWIHTLSQQEYLGDGTFNDRLTLGLENLSGFWTYNPANVPTYMTGVWGSTKNADDFMSASGYVRLGDTMGHLTLGDNQEAIVPLSYIKNYISYKGMPKNITQTNQYQARDTRRRFAGGASLEGQGGTYEPFYLPLSQSIRQFMPGELDMAVLEATRFMNSDRARQFMNSFREMINIFPAESGFKVAPNSSIINFADDFGKKLAADAKIEEIRSAEAWKDFKPTWEQEEPWLEKLNLIDPFWSSLYSKMGGQDSILGATMDSRISVINALEDIIGSPLYMDRILNNDFELWKAGILNITDPQKVNMFQKMLNLPKYHTGGLVNYAYGKEIAAMLEGGEVVIPKEVVKNVQNGGATNSNSVYNNITVNVPQTNASPQEIATAVSIAMQNRAGRDRTRTVIR